MTNLEMQSFALLHVCGRTISDLRNFGSLLLHGIFPTWFDIKLDHQITHESKHLFDLIQIINTLSNREIREVALDAVQRNVHILPIQKAYLLQ